jgi:trehalose 6-phosphate phosphatase
MSPSQELAELEKALSPLMSAERFLVALDRDGTTIPHRTDPFESKVDQELREIVTRLVKLPRIILAIVSARSLDILEQDFDRSEVILAGVYGLEIAIPGRKLLVQEAAGNVAPEVNQLRAELMEFTAPEIGAVMEADAYSVYLSWQAVSQAGREQMEKTATALIQGFPNMQMNVLRNGIEFLPRMEWDKSMALDAIVAQVVPSDATCSYLYAGDAAADEPVFRWVNHRGGLSIKLGEDGDDTQAKFKLKEIESLREFLRIICRTML